MLSHLACLVVLAYLKASHCVILESLLAVLDPCPTITFLTEECTRNRRCDGFDIMSAVDIEQKTSGSFKE